MKCLYKWQLIVLLSILFAPGLLGKQQEQSADSSYLLENEKLRAEVSAAGLVSLGDLLDPFEASVVSDRPMCRVSIAYRKAGEGWIETGQDIMTVESAGSESVRLVSNTEELPFRMIQTYTAGKDYIDLDVELESTATAPVRIGDFALGLPWRSPSGSNPTQIFEQSFTKHHFIAGDGSFVYFARASGVPPFIIVLPKKGTHLEYFDSEEGEYRVFAHSEVSGNAVPSGTWRMEHTGIDLGARGDARSRITYGFRLRSADSYDQLRQILYEEGLFDVRVVPGMSLPSDLKAQFSLHTKNSINSVTAEFPEQTTINYLGERLPGHHIYEVEFGRLGENMLTINHDDGRETHLEFFSTEPAETLIKKRSDFIVNQQQHRDPDKWYNGLYSVYDWKNSVLRGPDDTDGYDGWWGYVLAADDPALGKAPFIAAKNVYYPDEDEIASVEYYIENFVWDGLQRTGEDDPYPYGIYGTPNWKVARDPELRAEIESSRNLDKMKVWRAYDYPHIFMLYYHMYEVAKMYPEKVNYLDAEGYLERAYQTARAYFLYPYEILPYYEIYQWGYYNELVLEDLIRDLENLGRQDDADWLRAEWEKKVLYFVYDDPYPYRSEYAFDRTAFESSYALARYGTLNDIEPGTNLWFNKSTEQWHSYDEVRREDSREFMDRQHYAGLAVRGWLTPKYFLLGSDFTRSSNTHCLSYMARMGGWSILDYGINFSELPYDWLQLGYASYLSSWSLMNTGTPGSDYGFWAPGEHNDGALGWAFMESKHGRAWIRKQVDRGAWFYCGEADLGMCATFRMAQTVLTDDPVFGWIALGGEIHEISNGFLINPRDGVRNRFAIATKDNRFTVELNRDGFVRDADIFVDRSLNSISFSLENRSDDSHQTIMRFFTLPGQQVRVLCDGAPVVTRRTGERELEAILDISSSTHQVTVELAE